MKKYFLLLIVSLAGCMYQTVNTTELESAIKVCGSVNDIALLKSHAVGRLAILCKNGTRRVSSEGVLQPE